jgi:hypothetical protein
MIQKYIIVVDEHNQTIILEKIKAKLQEEGFELIYKELNPTNYTKRNNEDIHFDKQRFENDLANISYFKMADMILCDYNLIANVVNGYEIIKIIRELKYKPKTKVILYSAQIDGIIADILIKDTDFEIQKKNLVTLVDCNIEFIKRDGFDQEVYKTIREEANFDFETELINWFHKREKDTFNYLFPKYQGKTFGKIAEELENDTYDSNQFKKELAEQIIAYLSKINGL